MFILLRKNPQNWLLLAALSCAHPAPTQQPAADTQPATLQVVQLAAQDLHNPMGLGARHPNLSWQHQTSERAQSQSAYQILVSSSEAGLQQDQGDLWDSGRVESNAQVQIAYGGTGLESGQRVYWKVRVWDQDGRGSVWSDAAWWEMGLLEPSDWKAKWIASPISNVKPNRPMGLDRAKWIWHQDPPTDEWVMADGPRLLRRAFRLPKARKIVRAQLYGAGNDVAVVSINGKEVTTYKLGQPTAIQDVQSFLRSGDNLVQVAAHNRGGPAGLIARLRVQFESGPPLDILTDGDWQTQKQGDKKWGAPLIVTGYDQEPFVGRPALPAWAPPTPYFHKGFELSDDVADARLYIVGVGYHDVHINGARVGDHVLDPSYTDFSKRVQMVVHDVTSLLQKGDNGIGVVLGNGLFQQHDRDAWQFQKAPWRASPRMRAQLHVRYRNGQQTVLVSDGSWTTGPGAITYDGTRHGETYDARLVDAVWGQPGRGPKSFVPADVVPGPSGHLVAQEHPPIRVTETRKAAAVSEPSAGVFIVDAGQNLAGWLRLHVQGPAGTRIQLRYAEKITEDGNLDASNIAGLVRSTRFQTDEYVLSGQGQETWEPRFAYHGFQFVEIKGWPGKPTADNFDVRVVHTDFASAGEFESSNATLNGIQHATRWAYRSNFHSIPTDCPHREKNGWTGDAHLAIAAGLFNFDSASIYRKWIDDLLDSQRQQGDLPGIVPSGGWGFDNWSGPSWEAVLFEIPWALYVYRGDRQILQAVFPAWERYLKYADTRSQDSDGLADFGLGDWVPLKTKTPVAVTSTAVVHRLALLAERAAMVLQKPERAEAHAALAKRIARDFARHFIDANTGRVSKDEQTAMGMALYHGLVDEPLRSRIAERLHAAVAKDGYHLDTGVLGAKYVPRALSQNGYLDAAYRIFAAEDFPSWGHWIKRGATTLWENWDGQASRNHIFFGDISAWFFDRLAGIQPNEAAPGFAEFTLAPFVPEGLQQASATYQSVRGKIASSWRRQNDGVHYQFTVPPNSVANVHLLADQASQISEGGTPLDQVQGVTLGESAVSGTVAFKLGSGEYHFVVAP